LSRRAKVSSTMDHRSGDLIYLPQGCVLYNQSHLGYFRTSRPEMGMVVEEQSRDGDSYRIFCMGAVYVAHADQIKRLTEREKTRC
jgi:hypothetical protein